MGPRMCLLPLGASGSKCVSDGSPGLTSAGQDEMGPCSQSLTLESCFLCQGCPADRVTCSPDPRVSSAHRRAKPVVTSMVQTSKWRHKEVSAPEGEAQTVWFQTQLLAGVWHRPVEHSLCPPGWHLHLPPEAVSCFSARDSPSLCPTRLHPSTCSAAS